MKNELLIPMYLQFFGEEGEGVEVSEVAEPTTDEAEVETSATTEDNSSESEDSTVQSAEENSKYAAARRRAEAEFAEKQRQYDAEFERRFKDYTNPITGEPIRNQKDYFAALDAQEKLKREEEFRSAGMNPEVIEDYINRQVENNPIVQQAQAVMQMAQQSQVESAVAESVKEISKLNPNIKTVQDVMSLPNAEQIIGYVRDNSMSLADAYKLANFNDLMAGKVKSAKQETLNNLNGVSHLNQTDGVTDGGGNEVEIPTNELAAWKRAFPHASAAELRKKYNSTL